MKYEAHKKIIETVSKLVGCTFTAEGKQIFSQLLSKLTGEFMIQYEKLQHTSSYPSAPKMHQFFLTHSSDHTSLFAVHDHLIDYKANVSQFFDDDFICYQKALQYIQPSISLVTYSDVLLVFDKLLIPYCSQVGIHTQYQAHRAIRKCLEINDTFEYLLFVDYVDVLDGKVPVNMFEGLFTNIQFTVMAWIALTAGLSYVILELCKLAWDETSVYTKTIDSTALVQAIQKDEEYKCLFKGVRLFLSTADTHMMFIQ